MKAKFIKSSQTTSEFLPVEASIIFMEILLY